MPITDLLAALQASASVVHTDMKLADLVAQARSAQPAPAQHAVEDD